VPDAASEREPRDAGITERATGGREPEPLAGWIEVLPERAATAGRRPALRIDGHPAHQPQVDDDAPVTDAVTCYTVSAAADGDRQIGSGGEQDGGHNVVDVERPSDEGRPPIEHPVERRAGGIERHPVLGADDRAAMLPAKVRERQLFDNGHALS